MTNKKNVTTETEWNPTDVELKQIGKGLRRSNALVDLADKIAHEYSDNEVLDFVGTLLDFRGVPAHRRENARRGVAEALGIETDKQPTTDHYSAMVRGINAVEHAMMCWCWANSPERTEEAITPEEVIADLRRELARCDPALGALEGEDVAAELSKGLKSAMMTTANITGYVRANRWTLAQLEKARARMK